MEITIAKVSMIPAVKNRNPENTKVFKRITKRKHAGIQKSLVM